MHRVSALSRVLPSGRRSEGTGGLAVPRRETRHPWRGSRHASPFDDSDATRHSQCSAIRPSRNRHMSMTSTGTGNTTNRGSARTGRGCRSHSPHRRQRPGSPRQRILDRQPEVGHERRNHRRPRLRHGQVGASRSARGFTCAIVEGDGHRRAVPPGLPERNRARPRRRKALMSCTVARCRAAESIWTRYRLERASTDVDRGSATP